MKQVYLCCLACWIISACHQSNIQTDNVQADSVIAIIEYQYNGYLIENQIRKANHYLDSIFPTIDDLNSKPALSAWYRLKANAMIHDLDNDSAVFYIQQSVRTAAAIDSTNIYLLRARLQKVEVALAIPDYQTAIAEGLPLYLLLMSHDPSNLSELCYFLSITFHKIKDYEASDKFIRDAIMFTTDPSKAAYFLVSFSTMLKERDTPPEHAIRILQDPELVRQMPTLEPVITSSLAQLHFNNNELDTAQALFYSMIELYKTMNVKDFSPYFRLGQIFAKKGLIKKSNLYLDSAITLAIPGKDHATIADIYRQRSLNFKSQGDYPQALRWMDSSNTYYAQNDSAAFTERSQHFEAQVKGKLKDQRIQNLSLISEVRKKESRQRLTQLIAALVISFLLICIIVLLTRRKQLRLQVREIQLQQRLLRSQMDPHFIFNALSVLQGLILQDQKDKAGSYLTRLSRLIQVSLVNARANYVPLEDEIAGLDSYLSMLQMQSNNHFDYNIDVYDGYQDDNIKIAPMLLQPFVENAILHGIRPLTDRIGLITVTVRKQTNLLYCVIEDNGVGRGHVAAPQTKPSLSTLITSERLSIIGKLTKTKGSLSIEDNANNGGYGTRVILHIPFKRSL